MDHHQAKGFRMQLNPFECVWVWLWVWQRDYVTLCDCVCLCSYACVCVCVCNLVTCTFKDVCSPLWSHSSHSPIYPYFLSLLPASFFGLFLSLLLPFPLLPAVPGDWQLRVLTAQSHYLSEPEGWWEKLCHTPLTTRSHFFTRAKPMQFTRAHTHTHTNYIHPVTDSTHLRFDRG